MDKRRDENIFEEMKKKKTSFRLWLVVGKEEQTIGHFLSMLAFISHSISVEKIHWISLVFDSLFDQTIYSNGQTFLYIQ